MSRKQCTCPKPGYFGHGPNDSTCELSEEQHAKRQHHLCYPTPKGTGWYRWQCMSCNRVFRRHPYAATCPNKQEVFANVLD